MLKSLLVLSATSLLVLTISQNAHASNWELSRLAAQLNEMSAGLAREAGKRGGYSSVSHNAERLSYETRQFVDSVRRDRSRAYLSGKFTDMQRYYNRLEEAMLRAVDRRQNPQLIAWFDEVNHLYRRLHFVLQDRVYTTPYRYPHPRVIVPGNRATPHVNSNRHDRNRRENRQRNEKSTARRSYGYQLNDYDHNSSVVQRQYDRLVRERVQRSSRIRDRNTEQRRPNHYEQDSRSQRFAR
ncbi:MAG: hypothetical protein WDZ76_07870 [Pseudohongiellaceae bacterium]